MFLTIKLFCVFLVISQNGAKIRKLPKRFFLGASTAAYQIEGGWNEDGKGPSIWDVATHMEPSPIRDSSTGDVAADSYQNYKRDVEMITELGLDFYQFSVSWPRILPTGFTHKINYAGLQYYDKLINEMLEKNVTPFITIYHYDLPHNLQKLGGWLNPNIVTHFADYAMILFENFGDRVKFWITVNEPKHICYEGYGSGEKAPFISLSGIAEYECAKNVLLAHARVYHLYDEHYRRKQKGKIGISVGCSWFEAVSDSISDQQAAQDARQFDWGQYLDPIFSKSGNFPVELRRNVDSKSNAQGFFRSRLPEFTKEELRTLQYSADFLGVKVYMTQMAYRDASLDGMYDVPSYMDDMGVAVLVDDNVGPQGQLGLLQDPWGFTKLLHELKSLYDNPPLMITEGGWSSSNGLSDEARIKYLRRYLAAVIDAVEDGCNVKGYSVWSLMDGFEWRNGYREKFGLYEVDFRTPARTRTPRRSAFVYKEIARTRTLDPGYVVPEHFVVDHVESDSESSDNETLA